jgi:membrane associated rhomboid family serine protease
VLLSCLLLIWMASCVSDGGVARVLALEHGAHKWWSTVTDSFYSSSRSLLARNLFLGYIFGRVVENTEGPQALWLTHIISSIGGLLNITCLLMHI